MAKKKTASRPETRPTPDAQAVAEDEDRSAYQAHYELLEARAKERPIAFTITESEYVVYHTHRRGMTLETVIADELDDWGPDDTWHRAIWQGQRCLAVLRPGPGGKPEVIRLDGRG